MAAFMTRQFYKQRADFEASCEGRDQRFTLPEDIDIQTDIPYINDGSNEHLFDIYRPSSASDKILPVVINVHGGGLLLGNKEFNKFFCAQLSAMGYVIFSIEYRLIPDCEIYDQFADVSAACTFINRHLAEYLGNPEQIYGVADSGGACLLNYAAAMSNCHRIAKAAHTAPPDIQFQALGYISGMFYTNRFDKIGLFLPKYLYGKNYKKQAFAPYINPEHPDIINALPPCLLITSYHDHLKRYTLSYVKALNRHHARYKLLNFPKKPKLTHAFSVFEPDLKESSYVIKKLHHFFTKYGEK